LFKANLVEWATAMTYQAASGAGAKNMLELIHQMDAITSSVGTQLDSPEFGILDIDETVTQCLRSAEFPVDSWGFPLAGSILPWIGDAKENGQSGEEWKNEAETNKILGNTDSAVSLDGLCVRIGAMRCHSQALTIKLREDLAISDIENLIDESNPWSTIVPNEKDATLAGLTPAAVAGSLTVPVGRIRKMNIGKRYISAFTAGDQLLWGAAEPLRRMLRIVLDYLD
jgi:aspartate-semialdehyde dehydrogenase